ncbi:hypothetical protein [Brevundimonas sp. R86498]|uniref:hypothetical protein n=1 Tax=Brevundimonas sp. R86498 TaxID=3093845 RepID=UPI0037C99918
MTMKKLERFALIAMAALGAAACASVPTYVSLDPSLPRAQLTFHKGYEGTGLFSSAVQNYALGADEYCDSAKHAALFKNVSGTESALRVTPDVRTVVWAFTTYLNSTIGAGGVLGRYDDCRNAVIFTPARNRNYDIRQASTNGDAQCSLVITDAATGAAVRNVEVRASPDCIPRTKAARGSNR